MEKRGVILLGVFVFVFSLSGVFAFSGLGDGSSGNPFNITNCTQLQEMSNNLTAHYQLVNNVDCSDTINWNSGLGFEPVGNGMVTFEGTFNGNDYNITDLFINRSSTDYVGLFGSIVEQYSCPGENFVRDVGLINVNINGRNRVGGIVGNSGCVRINNTKIIGNISGKDYIGGIVGVLENVGILENSNAEINITGINYVGGNIGAIWWMGKITNSYSSGNIVGNYSIGGLVGYSSWAGYFPELSLINNSYSDMKVLGNNSIGGLVGYQDYQEVINSYSTGNVSGNEYIGGLVGYDSENGEIKYSHSTGNVNGSYYVGGILGYSSGFVNDSYAIGNVNGTADYVGGIVGFGNYNLRINNSYSKGNITGNNLVGGIAGSSGGIIDNSYANGNVNGNNYTGGLAGFISTTLYGYGINNSYATGNVSGSINIGGLVGYSSDAGIENCFSIGNVSGNNYVGSLVGQLYVAGFANPHVTNSYWYNQSQGLDCYSGGNQNCTAVSSSSYFYNYENAPMNLTAGTGWDFVGVWDDILNGTSYPVLQWQGIEDTTSPTYNSVSHSSTYVGQSSTFSIYVNDNEALEENGQYIFSTNNTGEWVNDTAVNFTSTPSWANVSETLNSTVGMIVGYMWYFEDNAGNENSTSIYVLTTTAVPVVDPPSSGGSSTSTQTQNNYQLGREFLEQGEQFQLRRNSEISFRHREQSHSLTLNSFTSSSCKITIESDPIIATLEKDVAQEFDIDEDGVKDIEVVYQGVEGRDALVVVSKLVLVSGESEVYVNAEGGEVQETKSNEISTEELFGTDGSTSSEVEKTRTKTKHPLQTVLISLIVMGAIIAGLYSIGKNEKKKKDHYLGFFDK